jgi:crossover junction endodeoxyribonuclease RuvC
MRILGIDPGLEHTGYGVIDLDGNHHRFIACGRISTDTRAPLPERLARIAAGLADVIARHQPHEAAVEEVFVNKNPRSTLKLGEARGVCLLVPSQHGIPVSEYAATLVKKALVGTGAAEKTQVAHMVKVLLPASSTGKPLPPDAADALAVALTHAQHAAYAKLLRSA